MARRRLFRIERQEPRVGDDVDAEIAAHLALRREELMAQGMSGEQAGAEAARRFGDVERTRAAIVAIEQSQVTVVRRAAWWRGIGQDARYAVRLLRRNPLFTIATTLTLALGIGATAAISSIVYQVLLEPLPFPRQDRLVRLWPVDPSQTTDAALISTPDFEDWRQSQHAFVDLAAFWFIPGKSSVDLTGGGPPESLDPAFVTPTFFRTLGVAAEVGRTARPDEMQEGGQRVVVLSDGLWQRRFGGDSSIVGKAIVLQGIPHIVVGVMPPSMRFPGTGVGPDIWLSVLYESQDATPWKLRSMRWLNVVGRLRDGLTPAQARADIASVQRHSCGGVSRRR